MLSILEFVAYTIIAYSGIIILSVSFIKGIPDAKPRELVRVVFIFPALFAAFMLANVSPDITLEQIDITQNNSTGDLVFTENHTKSVTLLEPAWVSFHYALFVIYLLFVIYQILMILTFKGF